MSRSLARQLICSSVHAAFEIYHCNISLTVNVLVDTGSDVAALIGVGIVVFVLGLTEHLVAVLVFLFCICKKKQGEDLLC